MTFDYVAVLKDGTRQPTEYKVTVGAVRQYMADPHPANVKTANEYSFRQ